MTTVSRGDSRRRALWLVVAVLASLTMISAFASWYGEHVLLARYCAAPEETVRLLGEVLAEGTLPAETSRRHYVISARIAYLIPQRPDEETAPYLRRVTMYLRETC